MKKLTLIQKTVLIVVIVLFCGVYFGFTKYSEKNYAKNVKEATTQMIVVSTVSQLVTDYYSNIWRNAIYKEKTWSDYTSPYYCKDFNRALVIAKEDQSIVSFLKEMNNKVDTVEILMKDLNNPSSKNIELHTDMVDLYLSTKEFAKLANNPEGSLQSFNQRTGDLTSKISTLVEKIKLRQ